MLSEEENLEFENDRTKLLSQNTNEPTRKLHGEIGRFIYPPSDNEVNHDDIELCERRQSNVNNDMNENAQLSPNANVSGPNLFSKVPKRFILLTLLALGNFNMYCVRMCLNVAIVAMTRGEGNQSHSVGPHLSKPREAEFHWDKQFQGTILASLYWSYTALQIPAGLLSVKYGGSFLVGIAIFGSSVLTLATPFIVRQNVYAFIFLRVMEGGFLGLVAAAGMSLLSKWSPTYERSIFISVGYAGFLFGTVFSNTLSGVLAGSSWGWPSVFYFFGIQGIVWYLCWIYFAYEEPGDHPNISKAELDLIGNHRNSQLSLREIPWRYILTSVQVWAIIIPNFTDCWSFYTFMISFPGYLKDVLDLDITTVGLASSLPYVLSGVMTPTWGYFIDVIRRRNYISTTNARKLSEIAENGYTTVIQYVVTTFIASLAIHCVAGDLDESRQDYGFEGKIGRNGEISEPGSGVSAIFIVAMAFASSVTSAIAIVTIAIMLSNMSSSGPTSNIVDLAPKYSGILMGIANFACNLTGFISPEVVGALTVHGDPRHQWSIVFYVTACVNVLGVLFYCCFGSSEKQAWDDH